MPNPDIQQVITALTPYFSALLPYLWKATVEAGKAASGKMGEDAWAKAKQIADSLRPKLTKDANSAKVLKTAAQSPDDTENVEAVRGLIESILAKDRKLTKNLLKIASQINQSGMPRGIDIGVKGVQGNVTLGNITLTYHELDYTKLSATLKKTFPKDPVPQQLLENLRTFRVIHEHLGEWKHVHNCMNEVMIAMDMFLPSLRPGKFGIYFVSDEFELLQREWSQVKWRVDDLEQWAKTIKRIGKPFAQSESGCEGEPWAVDVIIAARLVDIEMIPHYFSTRRKRTYQLSRELHSKVTRYLYLADKHILEIATQLQTISQYVFGKMK